MSHVKFVVILIGKYLFVNCIYDVLCGAWINTAWFTVYPPISNLNEIADAIGFEITDLLVSKKINF